MSADNNNENRNLEENGTPDPYNVSDAYNSPDPYNVPEQMKQPEKTVNQPQQTAYTQPQQGMTEYERYQQSYNAANIPQPGQYYPTGMATASLVMGILGLVSAMTMLNYMLIIPLIFPLLGLIFGIIHKSKHYPAGKGTSTAGIVTSVIAMVISIGVLALMVYLIMFKMPDMLQIIKAYDPEMYDMYYEMFYETYPQWFEGITAVFANLFK